MSHRLLYPKEMQHGTGCGVKKTPFLELIKHPESGSYTFTLNYVERSNFHYLLKVSVKMRVAICVLLCIAAGCR